VARATDALAEEKTRGSAPHATLLLLGHALAHDYRSAPGDQPSTRTFYTKASLRNALATHGAHASEKSFHATPDQLGRWLAERPHRDRIGNVDLVVRFVGPTAPQREDGGQPRYLYLHVAISRASDGATLHDSRSLDTAFVPAPAVAMAAAVAKRIAEIPAPLPDFVGRDAVFKELTEELRAARTATYVLHGPPGSGKTELAIRVAHALADDFTIRLLIDARGLDAAPPDSPALLRTIIRRAEGAPDEHAASALDLVASLARTIGEQRALVVLDNVRDSNQIVDVRLPAGSALIATAREPIVYPGAELRLIDQLDPLSARALLVSASPATSAPLPQSWRDDPHVIGERPLRDTAAQVADLLAFLCGYAPIALRAAANLLRVGGIAPLDLATRLRDGRSRLASLGDIGIRAPVAAIFTVSYERLSEHAADALHRLGVFPADFDDAAARALAVDAAALGELRERGFVRRRDDGRWLLHDLYRLFALSRAAESDPATIRDTRALHAAYFSGVAAMVADYWRRGDADGEFALRAFEAEWANFAAAYAWAVSYAEETGDASAVDALVLDLRWILVHVRDTDALLAWSMKGSELAKAQHRWAQASRHLVSVAVAHYIRGDTDAEWQAQIEGRELAERAGDADLLRVHAAAIASSLDYAGHLPEALATFEKVVEIEAKADEWRNELSDQVGLSLVAYKMRNYRRAETAAKRAADLARAHGQQQELGNALGILGNIAAEDGEWTHAIDYYDHALKAFERSQYHAGADVVRANLGRARATVGDKGGVAAIHDALEAARGRGDRRGELHALSVLARLHAANHDWKAAVAAYGDALPLAEALQDQPREGILRLGRGEAHVALGDRDAAREDYERAQALLTWPPYATDIDTRLHDLLVAT
jgi:tetratricopeptide (TPR) repeat protein/DNA polymerase III delta prime subunit